MGVISDLTIDKSGNSVGPSCLSNGKQHEAGLGGLASVPLAKAREIAASFRAMLADGRNPIVERRAQRQLQRKRQTFGQIAEDFFATHESSWRNAKHAREWHTTLVTYAASLWDTPIDQVDTQSVLAILRPLWISKSTTASRVRGELK